MGESSSDDDEDKPTERPYNSLLQMLNAKSETSRSRKRRKLDHNDPNSQKDYSEEVEIRGDAQALEDQDDLENQEASEEEDAAEEDKAEVSDNEDEDSE